MRRTLALLAVAAASWAVVVYLTGGVLLRVGGVRVSSRSALNPALAALVSGVLAWSLATPGSRTRQVVGDILSTARHASGGLRRVARTPRAAGAIVGAAAVACVALGLSLAAPVAGGSDSYGYVSQAHLWSTGRLAVDEPLMRDLADLVPRDALAPLGYRPAQGGAAIVPTYSPGLPMLMGTFERLAGRDAVFTVVPVMGGIAVWATYLMGAGLGGPAVGLGGAVLIATSPSFLGALMFPESDVPTTAWWALSLALVLGRSADLKVGTTYGGRASALAAGAAAGTAILTRPNLVPLAVVPAALLLRGVRVRSRRHAIDRLFPFVVGLLPFCLTVAALNVHWYGSPLMSGYGPLDYLFQPANLWPNLRRYPVWLLQTQTPIVLLALLSPLYAASLAPAGMSARDARTMAIGWLVFVAGVIGCYLFYFPWDDPGYVRFLMPALPPLLVLTLVTAVALTKYLPADARVWVLVSMTALLALHGVRTAAAQNAFDNSGYLRYATAGRYLDRRLPPQSAVLAMQHSGSVRYYSGRTTIRYDLIPPSRLDAVLDRLRTLGYRPYILLEEWEEAPFRRRFEGVSAVGRLDWSPAAMLPSRSVKLYDPADGESTAARQRVITEIID